MPSPPPDDAALPRSGRAVRVRLWALLIFACGAAVLAVAIRLKPDPRGWGTHQQLSAAPCGMILVTGLPCPTCGMTTAFAHAIRGQFIRAFWAQPTGLALALATIAATLASAVVLFTGRPPRWPARYVTPFAVFFALLALLIGGWAFKLAVGLLDGSLPIRGVALSSPK
jgi:hypothetical protein